MKLSLFGERYATKTGILELMEDLGGALTAPTRPRMLGGGNPAVIPAMSRVFRSRMREILRDRDAYALLVGRYDSPRGRPTFLEAAAAYLRNRYGWPVTERNIAVTNGSQIAFYYLLNLFAGPVSDGGTRKVLFPLCPEYIGYADQATDPASFTTRRPTIEMLDRRTFKYRVDFDNLDAGEDIGAICVSRPTNPTGNVLTLEELRRLSELARARGIPLLIDNAYGLPFPGIVFGDAEPIWDEHVVLGMSLSKLGLPSVRNGIVVASEEVIAAVSAVNAVVSLATGGIGQAIVEPLLVSGKIDVLVDTVIRPYYRERRLRALGWVHGALEGVCDYAVHAAEGAFFLWIWFKDLPVSCRELYELLKRRGVVIVPGCYFFYGLEAPWEHREQCIRLSYAAGEAEVRGGIETIAEVVGSL